MPIPRSASNRFTFFLLLGTIILAVFYISRNGPADSPRLTSPTRDTAQHNLEPHQHPGQAISRKLGNETLKAELGRASWMLFHTMMAQFPNEPSIEEQVALESYVHLFQRLYPCGECAEHFRGILEEFPPQVSSRNTAAGWACHVHNQVNESLDKEIFDCSKIGDFYDCGCADDEENAGGPGGSTEEKNGSREM